ncbi:MAG: N-acetyltransferase [Myxococcaceae bacterium]|nr:N-acetyltransferase [Myxococcaceae bacterium]
MIRGERPDDLEAIRSLNRLAFGGDGEAHLVDALRASGHVIASLVAEQAGELAGHILFSPLPIRTAARMIPAASLAPMAVKPGFQRRGIGSQLVREGLEVCRAKGYEAVIVLGHPRYYPRFGFTAGLAKGITSPYSSHAEAWLALELQPGALAGVTGSVEYPPAFQSA